jgi:mannitol 2-dehydrogenase
VAYDRSRLTTGVVHLGVGGFHRAHQAMYHDRLLEQGLAADWAICGVGVLEGDRRVHDALAARHGEYTLVLVHPDGREEERKIGSILEHLLVPDDREAVLARLTAPVTRIVSLTVTEGGYDLTDPAAFELLAEALRRRRDQGTGPFTVMSMDNLQGNGEVARRALTTVAGGELAAWIDEQVAFPSSMVDRITPASPDPGRVVCEPFEQWVLEDRFCAGRPPYERAGVQVVADVEPYELMKLRLLNASHQALAYFAALDGYELVHDAAQDPLFRRFLRGYMDEEGGPTLPPVPGVDLDAYKATLLERFANPGVRDTVARLCAYSSDRIPAWLVPVIEERLRQGGEVRRSAAVVASWARYAERGGVVDQQAERIVAAARGGADAFLALFGELARDPRFADPFRATHARIGEHGPRAALEAVA